MVGRRSRPFFGQPIFDLAPVLGAGFAIEDADIDQPAEPVGEDVAGNTQVRLDLFEMLQAIEGGAQDQKGPALTHRFQRLGQAALRGDLRKRFSQAHPILFPVVKNLAEAAMFIKRQK